MLYGMMNAAKYLTGYTNEEEEAPLSKKELICQANYLRIQGAIHCLCLLLKGIETFLTISMPNPIDLDMEKGF
jgi:hypothetical protein